MLLCPMPKIDRHEITDFEPLDENYRGLGVGCWFEPVQEIIQKN